jgi:demethylmenaquinone methyltransferase/2-methoxy-6-polyprenyl-1,4-benzoquinol methylase
MMDALSDDKERTVQRMFSSAARRYDLNNTVLSMGLHYAWKGTAVEMAGVGPGDRVIDLCAGTADIALRLSRKMGPTGRVVALDLNPEMLQIGHFKVLREGLEDRIQCVVGTMEQINFPDNTFDAATVGFGIRNTSRMDQAFREMVRILKPGGRGVCLEFSKPTTGLVRWAYDLYSFSLLPTVGRWLSGDRTGIYQYLPESIRRFPDQETLRQIMLDAGFSRVEYRNLTDGIVAVHVGIK